MKRLFSGLAVAALLIAPASAQTVSRADVVAYCTTASAAECAAFLEAYIATLPPAARLAAYTEITADLADAGIVVAVAPPVAAAAPTVAPFAGIGEGAAEGGGDDGGSVPPTQGSPS